MEISKVVIPTIQPSDRFLPYGSAVPHEMLPLLLKPALQLLFEECIASQLNTIMLMNGPDKKSISEYSTNKLFQQATISSVSYPDTAGLGHALWRARHFFTKEYFALCLPEDIISNQQPGLAQLMRIARQEKGTVIAVQEIPTDMVNQHTMITIKKQLSPSLFQVSSLVEKPQSKDTPSNLAVIGRFIISSKIFTALDEMTAYAQEEMGLASALNRLVHLNERVFAYKIQGVRHSLNTPLGWLKALVYYAWNDAQYGPNLRAYLDDLSNLRAHITPAVMNPGTTVPTTTTTNAEINQNTREHTQLSLE